MRNAITNDDVIAILEKTATVMEAQKDYLCELDGAIGDGDQGVTMTIGFGAIRAVLGDLKGQDIGTILTKSGMAFNGKAASTIGVLFLTACLRAGREVKGLTQIGLAELAKMAEAAAAGIRERGKAEVGDKTLLDALVPAALALKTAAAEGHSLPEALVRSLAAAESGMQGTIPLRSKVGRASWIADRSVGHQDPGATSFYLMWKSAVEYLTGG
jgi:phosphoenolpyruvate---glycerone phosphotransferase subunit DhaL